MLTRRFVTRIIDAARLVSLEDDDGGYAEWTGCMFGSIRALDTMGRSNHERLRAE